MASGGLKVVVGRSVGARCWCRPLATVDEGGACRRGFPSRERGLTRGQRTREGESGQNILVLNRHDQPLRTLLR